MTFNSGIPSVEIYDQFKKSFLTCAVILGFENSRHVTKRLKNLITSPAWPDSTVAGKGPPTIQYLNPSAEREFGSEQRPKASIGRG